MIVGRRDFELSLLVFGVQRPQQLVPFAGAVKWDALERLWFGQSTTLDAAQQAAWLAGMGLDVPVGFAVSLLPLKSPTQAAIEARSVAALLNAPVVAGFGPGSSELQIGIGGHPYRKPLEAIREYVSAIRVLVGHHNAHDIEERDPTYFPQPVGPLPDVHSPTVEIGLGVLRPNSAVLAGEVADRAITWLLPARYLSEVIVPRIEQGASGRPRPLVSAIVPVAIARPGRDPMAMMGAAMGRHLQEPHYQDAVRQAGISITGTDLSADMQSCLDGSLLSYGTVADVADQILGYVDAGADEVVLNLSGVAQTAGMKAALQDLQELLTHLKGMEQMTGITPKVTHEIQTQETHYVS